MPVPYTFANLPNGTAIPLSYLDEDFAYLQNEINNIIDNAAFGIINAKQYGAVGDGIADDTVAIQTAVNYAINTGAVLFVPQGKYRLTSQIEINKPVVIQGDYANIATPATSPNTPGTGTWFFLDHSGIGFFCRDNSLVGVAKQFVYFSNFGTYRTHPTPGSGWVPTVYSEDFRVEFRVYAFNLVLLNPYTAFYIRSGGVLKANNIIGQPLYRGFIYERSPDVNYLTNIQWWPFWSLDANVQLYTINNSIGVQVSRCDGLYITNYFTVYYKWLINAEDVNGAGSGLANFAFTNIYADGTGGGINITSNYYSAFGTMNGVCVNSDPSVRGSGAGISINGTVACDISITDLEVTRAHEQAILVSGAAHNVFLQANRIYNWGRLNIALPAISANDGSIIRMASVPSFSVTPPNRYAQATGGKITQPTIYDAVTNQTQVTAGSAAVPSVASPADLATGLYFPAVGSVALSTSGSDAFRVSATKKAAIGGSPAAQFNLWILNQFSGSADPQGIVQSGEIQSSSTGTCVVYGSQPTTAAASFTLANATHFRANNITLGAGSAITTHTGFQSLALLSGTNNFGFFALDAAAITAGKTNYGFYSANDIATGGGTTWNFYAAGTASNLFAGDVIFGQQQTRQGKIILGNTAAGAFQTTIQSSNSASAAWTLTLPTTAGTNNYVLTTNGSGVSSWGQVSLTAGVTGILPTGNGGTGLTGFTAANNAIYSTSASALTAGTLPAAAGGTGLTGFTAANNAIYSTSASALTAGTLPIAAGGTGGTTDSQARTNLGLGTAAVKNTGSTADTIPLLDANGSLSNERVAASAGWGSVTKSVGVSNESGIYFDASNNSEIDARDGSGNLRVRWQTVSPSSNLVDGIPAYVCRAWVNFDGTGTPAIRASGNVTSITDNGTGDYTINFTTAMPDANYSVTGIASYTSGAEPGSVMVALASASSYVSKTTTEVRIYVTDTNAIGYLDCYDVNVSIFR